MFMIGTYILLCLIFTAFVYSERWWWSFGDLIVSLALLQWLGYINALAWWEFAKTDPQALIVGLAVYICVGIAYSLWRWRRFVRPIARKFMAVREKFMKEHDGADPLTFMKSYKTEYRDHLDKWREQWSDSRVDVTEEGKPTIRARGYKSRITGWMAYWPWSLLGWLIGDFLVDAFGAIYELFAGVFQRVADSSFK